MRKEKLWGIRVKKLWIVKEKKLWIIRGIILVLSACFITLGVMGGEPFEVWKKAVNICLQCIGIG